MAQNYINYFETDSLYNAAKSGLSSPNVSFVKNSGNLHYTKHLYGLAASELGDIILEDSTKLYSVNPDNYNLTDFPLETYNLVGINVISASQSGDGKHRVLSLRMMDPSNPGVAFLRGGYYYYDSPSFTGILWGYNGQNLGDLNSDFQNTSLLNGKEITNYIINNLQTVYWGGSSLSTENIEGNYPVFCLASRYHTNITQEGDWYIPSAKELQYIFLDSLNKEYVNYTYNIVKTITGKYGNYNLLYYSFPSSTEYDTNRYQVVLSNGNLYNYNAYKYNNVTPIPFLQIGTEEV